eukprot:gnl/TRDRNA2_/TRDRNA2_85947_c0_seq1.p1 gnl/TRDRNA2_/TRDRNA2_85947_c0~~gnl/TRDRNA2_/TRDRNA2_85947_c0_seq1.p1  ORF type:complete len:113 (+),score=5.56 gnl/TRDRNA2_/TRDRNA2_85947_c0_seq1:133-471(+)
MMYILYSFQARMKFYSLHDELFGDGVSRRPIMHQRWLASSLLGLASPDTVQRGCEHATTNFSQDASLLPAHHAPAIAGLFFPALLRLASPDTLQQGCEHATCGSRICDTCHV